jgi:hypothetical protein
MPPIRFKPAIPASGRLQTLALDRFLFPCSFYFICTCSCVSVIPQFYLLVFYLHHTTETSMHPAVLEPATPASNRPQTLALDRSASGIGDEINCRYLSCSLYRPATLLGGRPSGVQCSLNRRLRGPHSQSGHWEEQNIWNVVVQLFTNLTELTRFAVLEHVIHSFRKRCYEGCAFSVEQKKLRTVGSTVHCVESVTDKDVPDRADNVLICLFTNCVEG